MLATGDVCHRRGSGMWWPVHHTGLVHCQFAFLLPLRTHLQYTRLTHEFPMENSFLFPLESAPHPS